MKDGALILDFAREERRLKVSFFEGGEKTLRPYEIHEVAWEQLDKACLEIINLLRRSNRGAKLTPEILNSLKKSGQLLFDLLIPSKAKEKLDSTTAQSLTLHLDDSLVHIPWELLYDGREFLCRRFAIGRIASTRQTPTSRSSRTLKAPFKVLILADPRGDLQASYREGLEIKAFLDERRDVFHVDFKSHPVDISFVKKNLRDYDIVHYGGHADYHAQNPCESGWLLTDGKLRANDICTMGGLQPMPLLVFSNACQSGQTGEWQIKEGCEQEIFGLANAYLLSGVQHYIGTFWEIVDEPSSYFAKRFYGFLADGDPVGAALRKARQALIDAYGEETLVWASYMLYGDPTYEFAVGEKERPPQPIMQKPARTASQQLLRGPMSVAATTAKAPRSRFFYPLTATLLLASVTIGYSLYSAPWKKRVTPTELPTAQVALKAETVASTEIRAPLSVTMNVIGQRKEGDGSYTEVVVREGSVLRSGDNFQVHLESNRPSHIYVLLFDSQGQASQLFPDPKIEQPGFIEGGRKIAVPDKDLWFWLDENPGTETVYVLVAEKPMSDIRGLLVKMEKANEAERKRLSGEIKQRIGIVERGVGGVDKGKAVSYTLSDGRTIQKVTDVVASSGSVVRAVSFHHR